MIVDDRPQQVADWVAAQRGAVAPTVDHAIGFVYEGELRSGVYFDGMTNNNIFVHVASNAPVFPRSLLLALGFFVYDRLGLERMTLAVPSSHTKLTAFVAGMGAQFEGRLARACGDADLNLYVMWWNDPFPQRLLNLTEPRNGK